METTYDYQLNVYFGLFYPEDMIDTVLGLLGTTTYADLASERAELRISGTTYFASTNSDVGDTAIVGFITTDCLTIGGLNSRRPMDIMVNIDPSSMLKAEQKYAAAVRTIEDIYKAIVRGLKGSRSKDYLKLYCGWRAISCTFDASGSSSESPRPTKAEKSEDAPRRPTKAEKAEKSEDSPLPPSRPRGRHRH